MHQKNLIFDSVFMLKSKIWSAWKVIQQWWTTRMIRSFSTYQSIKTFLCLRWLFLDLNTCRKASFHKYICLSLKSALSRTRFFEKYLAQFLVDILGVWGFYLRLYNRCLSNDSKKIHNLRLIKVKRQFN